MTTYRLTSASHREQVVEFEGDDAVSALNIATRCNLAEADLWQGEIYCVTLRRSGGPNGDFWMIFRKGELTQDCRQPEEVLQGGPQLVDCP